MHIFYLYLLFSLLQNYKRMLECILKNEQLITNYAKNPTTPMNSANASCGNRSSNESEQE